MISDAERQILSSSSQAWWARSDKSSGSTAKTELILLHSDHCKTNKPNLQPKTQPRIAHKHLVLPLGSVSST